MDDASLRKGQVLIVGLGNPGNRYSLTRHNLGFSVVTAFGEEHNWTFTKSDQFKGRIAKGMIHDLKVYLLMPSTFMNNSGLAVRKCVDFFKISLENLLVVADDINIDFGRLRLREQGSDGGHNGLKSIEEHLHSQDYVRLRMGIGNTYIGSLEEYVLSNFSEEELENLPHILGEAKIVLDTWIKGDTKRAKEAASKAKLPLVKRDLPTNGESSSDNLRRG